MNMKIETLVKAAHATFIAELKDCLDDMMDSFDARGKGKEFAVFHDDLEADKAEIQKHIDALDLIIRYYDEVPS
jgi:hypothetical protein